MKAKPGCRCRPKTVTKALSTTVVTHTPRNGLLWEPADRATSEGAVTSSGVCDFIPSMSNVGLDMSKFQVLDALDGSDQRGDEVRRGLEGPRMSSTPRGDKAHAFTMNDKTTTKEGALEDPEQIEKVGDVLGVEGQVKGCANVP